MYRNSAIHTAVEALREVAATSNFHPSAERSIVSNRVKLDIPSTEVTVKYCCTRLVDESTCVLITNNYKTFIRNIRLNTLGDEVDAEPLSRIHHLDKIEDLEGLVLKLKENDIQTILYHTCELPFAFYIMANRHNYTPFVIVEIKSRLLSMRNLFDILSTSNKGETQLQL